MMKIEKDDRKLSVYLPKPILEELNATALRLERSKSWVLQKAWELAKKDLKKLHSPYPKDLTARFARLSETYSQATRGISEAQINKIAVDAVKKVRKKVD